MADTVRELVIKISVENETEKGFSDVEKGQERAEAKSVALGTALGGLAVELGKVALQAAAAGAAMLKDLVFGTAAAADEIAKTSAKLDVATDQLQRLRGAAELSGAAASDLDSGIRDLQKGLGEAITKGTGPAVEGLAALGLSAFEVDAALAEGDIEGALGLIGEAANGVGNSSVRNAALVKVLGGAGAELGPLLAQGEAGIKGLGDQISATGSVIEDDALGQFEALQDSQLLLDKQLEGITNTIATAAAPAFTNIGDQIRVWTSENQGIIDQDLPALLVSLAETAVNLVTATLELVSVWREFSRDVSNLAEIIVEDLDPSLDGVSGAFATIEAAVNGASLAVLDLVDSFLEAVGAGEELRQIFKEIRGDIAGDTGTKGTRGAPGFLGGGSSLVDPKDFAAAESSGDTTKLKKIAEDPKFSESDRARAAATAAKIDTKAATDAQNEANAAAERRQAGIAASRNRARQAQRATRRGARRAQVGGGTGGAAQPTVEELIQAAGPGGASPAALRSASSALSGTLLVTTNNIFNNTVDVGGIQVSAAIEDVGAETAEALAPVIDSALERQNRAAIEYLVARGNVGF